MLPVNESKTYSEEDELVECNEEQRCNKSIGKNGMKELHVPSYTTFFNLKVH